MDRLSDRPSFSPSPIISASVLALPNPSSGHSFPELPSVRRRHWKRWIHCRFRHHRNRRRRSAGPAPSSRRQLLGPSASTILAAVSLSTPRIGLNSPPRTLPALQRPISMDLYGFNSAPTVRENHTVTGSHSGRRNIAIPDALSRFIGPLAFTSAHTTSSTDTTTPPARAWGASPHPFKTTRSVSIGPFFELLHHQFPRRPWPYQGHLLACTVHDFTERQLLFSELATPRDREPSSRGIIAFSPPLFFCLR